MNECWLKGVVDNNHMSRRFTNWWEMTKRLELIDGSRNYFRSLSLTRRDEKCRKLNHREIKDHDN